MLDLSALDSVPAMMPPSGAIPNFENPYSLAPIGTIVIGVSLPLAIISVASRLYTRFCITHSIGADDCKSSNLCKIEICSTNILTTDLCVVSAVGRRPASLVAGYTNVGKQAGVISYSAVVLACELVGQR